MYHIERATIFMKFIVTWVFSYNTKLGFTRLLNEFE